MFEIYLYLVINIGIAKNILYKHNAKFYANVTQST